MGGARGLFPDLAIRYFPDYYDQDQLYDLREDPHETRNFADDPDKQEALRQHRRLMRQVLKARKRTGVLPEGDGTDQVREEKNV
jgi:hypothetical protein